MSDIHIGVNKQEVVNAMLRTPDNVIGAKKYKEGTVEILKYSRRLTLDTKIAEVYWLYFFNNQLVLWAEQGIGRIKLTACTSSDTGNKVIHVLF